MNGHDEQGTYVLSYTTSKNRIRVLTFHWLSDVEKWEDILDRRIKKGTCGGYIVTKTD